MEDTKYKQQLEELRQIIQSLYDDYHYLEQLREYQEFSTEFLNELTENLFEYIDDCFVQEGWLIYNVELENLYKQTQANNLYVRLRAYKRLGELVPNKNKFIRAHNRHSN